MYIHICIYLYRYICKSEEKNRAYPLEGKNKFKTVHNK